jgi:hypothetical protein
MGPAGNPCRDCMVSPLHVTASVPSMRNSHEAGVGLTWPLLFQICFTPMVLARHLVRETRASDGPSTRLRGRPSREGPLPESRPREGRECAEIMGNRSEISLIWSSRDRGGYLAYTAYVPDHDRRDGWDYTPNRATQDALLDV